MLSAMDKVATPAPTAICQWVTCPNPSLSGGYLCETHLAKVLHARPNLRATFKEVSLGLGIGIAGNALYQALAILPSLSMFQYRGAEKDVRPRVRHGAYASEEEIERELEELEELGWEPATQELAYDRFIELLSGSKAKPNA